ncbi:MAG: Ig-like domain-containing protein [Gemmatimonadota bacterium]
MNRIRWSGARSPLILLVFGALACGSDSSGPPRAGPPAVLSVVSGSGQEGQSGEALAAPLSVKVEDAKGIPVPKAIVTFTVSAGGGTLSSATDTTDAQGLASVTWVMGASLGNARAEARVTGLLAPAVFTATVKAGPPTSMTQSSSAVGSSAAGFDVSDSIALKLTDRFNHPIAGATVAFAVTAGGGTVSPATRTTGADGSARAAWRLGASGPQTLRATSGSFTVDVQGSAMACEERALAVGDVVSILPTTASLCLVTNSTGAQKYVVAVSNTNTTPTSIAAFRLRGAGGGTVTAGSAPRPIAAARGQALPAAQARYLEELEAGARAHTGLLGANLELIQRLAPAQRAQARISAQAVQRAPLPNVGDMLSIKIPRNFNNLCAISSAAQIRARVVYVGAKAVMLEDSASALAGEFDDRIRAVGQEFDQVMYPILEANYGNPLAMDDQTDQNGRIFMVFSPVVNALQDGGIAGFVTSGDFFPTGSCAASNVGEYFYARAPTSPDAGFATGTIEDWARRVRTVIVHEVKHITSFAEKFASPLVLPPDYFDRNTWLEEASAMMAEELWARTVFGYRQRGNADYLSSIYCEVRPAPNPSWPQCQPTRPRSLLDHFFFVYNYLENPEAFSAIGAADPNDFNFYGSGWLLLRWVIDTYAASEAAFLLAMNRDMVAPGTANLEARTGKPFADLMSDFALALALDDYPNFAAKDPKHAIVSWNTRDVFRGLNADFAAQGFFTKSQPLKVRPASLGSFVIDVSAVHGGGFAVFEVTGNSTNKQLLEFRGLAGAGFPADMRVKIARVQ